MRLFKPSPEQLYLVVTPDLGLAEATKLIEENEDIEIVHIESDPLKRDREEFKTFLETCVASRVPVSFETSSDLPDEVISLINRHRYSEIRFNLPTTDAKKLKRLLPAADDPDTICNGIVRTFNSGSYAILNVTPVIPGLTSIQDILALVVQIHNFVEFIEVDFASFTEREFKKLVKSWKRTNPEIESFYELEGKRMVVKPEIKEKFFNKLNGFATGLKIKMVVKENGMEQYGRIFER